MIFEHNRNMHSQSHWCHHCGFCDLLRILGRICLNYGSIEIRMFFLYFLFLLGWNMKTKLCYIQYVWKAVKTKLQALPLVMITKYQHTLSFSNIWKIIILYRQDSDSVLCSRIPLTQCVPVFSSTPHFTASQRDNETCNFVIRHSTCGTRLFVSVCDNHCRQEHVETLAPCTWQYMSTCVVLFHVQPHRWCYKNKIGTYIASIHSFCLFVSY